MNARLFRNRDAFDAGQADAYQLLPFRFMRWDSGEVLVTNEAGEFEFLSSETFGALVSRRLSPREPAYLDLKAKHFLSDTASTLPIELLATKCRTKRHFLDGFTRLHIMVVTLRCDHTCPYCQVSRVTEDRARYDMSTETAARAIEWIFSSPARELKIEFQGGEPSLNAGVIEFTVHAARERASREGRSVEFVIATNLSTLDDKLLRLCQAHKILISTSCDGPEDLHNSNRPRRGRDSYARFAENLERARAALGQDRVSALMTTTPASLSRVREIIDTYVSLGFDSVFLRPISPYGFAIRTGLDSAYTSSRFMEFFIEGLEYIIDLNRRGIPFVETYAQILLRKMLTPFPVGYVDLQSPAGAALGVLVYNYDGDVYASDESRMLAEMGDHSFRLGSLHRDRYEDVMGGERVRAIAENSCLECLPGCSECAFVPYCGADPVYNWATQGDPIGHRPTSAFCKRQTGLFTYLFDRWQHGDDFLRRLFLAWAAQ